MKDSYRSLQVTDCEAKEEGLPQVPSDAYKHVSHTGNVAGADLGAKPVRDFHKLHVHAK